MPFGIYEWHSAKLEFCRSLKQARSTLKILLKTKDDPWFLERWITHHEKIVGRENLVIFDNMSSDPNVLRIYRKYAGDMHIVRFGGSHNAVHNIEAYRDLYDCLEDACEYFTFLDTDEFLGLTEDGETFAPEKIVKFLQDHASCDVFPGTWFYNCVGSDEYYRIGMSLEDIAPGVTWGKPIIRSTARISGHVNHNVQVNNHIYGEVIPANIIVLHLAQRFPEQRIAVNIKKLRQRNFASDDESVEAITKKSCDGLHDQNIKLYVDEIKRMLEYSCNPSSIVQDLAPGLMRIRPSGRIEFNGDVEANLLRTLAKEANLFIRQSLGLGQTLMQEMSAAALREEAIRRRDAQNFEGAEAALLLGIRLFPNELDQYGHPTFRKELMRMLLSRREWDRAACLIPAAGDLGGDHWHKILFARAYSEVGDGSNANLWWGRAQEYYESNEN